MQLTLANLQGRVYSRIDNNTLLYPSDQVTTLINEAVRTINLITGFQQVSLIIPYQTQSNRIWYDIPNQIIFPLRVKIGDTYLQPSSMLSIGRSNPQWITETTDNTVSPVASWVRFGFRKLAIHPADAVGGQDITVTGVAEPPLLIEPTDTIQFSNDILSAFDLYATFSLTMKESPKEFAANSTAYQDFLRLVKRLTIWKNFVAPRYYLNESSQPLNR